MSRSLAPIGLVLAWFSIAAGPALGASREEATALFAQGDVLLAQADFTAALKAYANAAKADPEAQAYRQQYAMVRRIIKMREAIEQEKNPEKWESTARALRSFYYEHGIHGEALGLDRQFHTRLNTAESAAMLAETELTLGMNAEAAELLSGLGEDKNSLQTQVFLGIALARLEQVDKAKTIAEGCKVPDDAGPGTLFDVARLRALIGDASGALALLARSFESTPPSRLDAFKDYAKKAPDLSAVVARADFAKVLETASKVPESSCSGGTSCGKCPSQSSCSSKSSKSSTPSCDEHEKK